MATSLPDRVQPREPIRAEDFNALRDGLEELRGRGGAGPLAGMVQGEGRTLLGIVLATHGAVPALEPVEPGGYPFAGSPARDVTYDLSVLYKGFVIEGVVPDLGRPVRRESATKIMPAAPGDRCVIVRFPDGAGGFVNYVILSETLEFKRC